MSASERVDSFGVALPHDWVRLPLDRTEFERFVRQQRRRLAGRGDLSPTARRRLELLLRQVRNDCVRADVSLVAMFAAPVEQPGGGQPGLLAATCTLASLDRPRLGTELPLTVHTILAAVTHPARSASGAAPADPPQQTGQPHPADCPQPADLVPPAVVDLPCGRAVRLLRLDTPGDAAVPWLSTHFLVPYDAGERAVALTLATPNVEHAAPLTALFDELARSLRLFAGGDPTDPTAVPDAAGGTAG